MNQELFEFTASPASPAVLQDKSAVLSPCRTYRYELWRRWAEGPYCLFIGLNPSTADETTDDPTIRRCVNFARAWGYGSLCMVNLFAFRATEPAVMKAHAEPVGPGNNETLVRLASGAGVAIAAWGTDGVHQGRDMIVRALLPKLMCLGLSAKGHPRHPLYLKKTCEPFPL